MPKSRTDIGTETKDRHCLLIVPRHFYSFENHICGELERRGYRVTVANDEYPRGMLGKILGKLQIPYVFTATEREFDRRYLGYGRRYDLALIFKGRGVSIGLIEKLRHTAGVVVGYNWDSFRLNRSPLRWLRAVSMYATFDYRDAQRWSLPVIELFSAAHTLSGDKSYEYEVSAIVRNHSGRLRYIDRVFRTLQPCSSYISIFELNVFTFVFNFLRTPLLYVKYWRQIRFKPVPYEEYSRVMAESLFTIDYAHDTQTGITMRCFEAVNARTKIITNNVYITRSPHFAPSDYVVFDDRVPRPGLDEALRRAAAQPFTSHPRTIAHFIDDLLRPCGARLASNPF